MGCGGGATRVASSRQHGPTTRGGALAGTRPGRTTRSVRTTATCMHCRATAALLASCTSGPHYSNASARLCDANVCVMTTVTSRSVIFAGSLQPGLKPVLCFINTKSGPQIGKDLRRKFMRILNPLQASCTTPIACFAIAQSRCQHLILGCLLAATCVTLLSFCSTSVHQRFAPGQVVELPREKPERALELFADMPGLRLLIIGGDGTVGWVLSCLDALQVIRVLRVSVCRQERVDWILSGIWNRRLGAVLPGRAAGDCI